MHAYNLYQDTHDYILITFIHRKGAKNEKVLKIFATEGIEIIFS